MSEEESSPAPLRLRPRKRPADSPEPDAGAPSAPAPTPAPATPPPPAASAPVTPPPAASEPTPSAEPPAAEPDRPRLRAKPRLNIAEDTTEPAAAETKPAASADLPPPAPSAASASEPAEATPLKLRLQTPQAAATPPPPPLPPPAPPAAPASSATPPPPPPASLDVDLPPLPPTPPDFSSGEESVTLRPPDHLVPHISAPQPVREIEKQVRAPVPASSLRKKKSPLKAVLVIAAVLLVIGAGFWFAGTAIYDKFFAEDVAEVAQLPAKLIDKAQGAVEDRRSLEQARVDAMGEGREVPTQRAIGPAPTPTPEATPAPTDGSVTAYAPGEVTVPEVQAEPAAPQPGPEFIAFVETARIGGVFQGSPARAFINGRTVRAGETVDERLGVVFVGLDDSRLRLIFRDASGAEVIRKF